ncbi:plasmid segregation protein ParM domain-containing protein [Yersinia sp. 1652 StPb PI]|uniref:plasmid segregation protein ParM domain-containing protein n=1 Tax=Yersinia sp. 1652 StPb PI TaxID=3061649 RepID=UPI00355C2643
MFNVSCDDGSTYVKPAWLEQDEIKTHLSGNSFKDGWSPAILGMRKVFNYNVDGKKYSHDLGSDPLPVCDPFIIRNNRIVTRSPYVIHS